MEMLEDYTNFMVFELLDSGERQRLNLEEQEFRENNGDILLHDSQVVIIIKEEIRRIYIWKGYQSSVRKKFIASRIAQDLQQELTNIAKLHRCKIVSVDQGEEPQEFLNAFAFKKHEISEDDRNNHAKNVASYISIKPKSTLKMKSYKLDYHIRESNSVIKPKTLISSRSTNLIKNTEEKSKKILNKVKNVEVPKNFKRKNILVGNNTLYGILIKKAEIFGKPIEESEWAPIKNLSKEIIELNGHKLRFHIDPKNNIIEAIEVLEKLSPKESEAKIKEEKADSKEIKAKEIDYSKWTVKELKAFCRKNNIHVPSSYRKAQIIGLVKEFNENRH